MCWTCGNNNTSQPVTQNVTKPKSNVKEKIALPTPYGRTIISAKK